MFITFLDTFNIFSNVSDLIIVYVVSIGQETGKKIKLLFR